MRIRPFILLLCVFLGHMVEAHAQPPEPEWYKSVDFMSSLMDPAAIFAPMRDILAKFTLLFTAIGYGAVVISSTLKIARARTGNESMGWIGSTMMAIAMMAVSPTIGDWVYQAGDDVAEWSGFDRFSALSACWSSVILVVPASSPAKDSADVGIAARAASDGALSPSAAPEEIPWYERAGAWFVGAWSGIKDTVGGMFTAIQTVATKLLVAVMLVVPAICMLIACLIILLGELARQIIHNSMNVFLPCMIGMLTFDLFRGAATTFLIRYVSIAFWPVAWCLGNAIAVSLVDVVAAWVVKTSMETLAAAAGAVLVEPLPVAGVATSGLFAAAAVHMAWGLILAVVLVMVFVGIMIIASAILAPAALSSVFTKGASFAGGLLKAAAAGTAAVGGVAAGAAGGLVASGGAARGAAGLGQMMSGLANRASGALGGMAGQLSGVAAGGGPLGSLAGAGASMLNRASSALQGAGNMGNRAASTMAASMSPESASGRSLATMMSTAGNLMQGASALRLEDEESVGQGAGAFTGAVGRRMGGAAARTYRWANNRSGN